MSGITLKIRKQLESCTIFMVLLILIVGINITECRNIQIKTHDNVPKVITQCRAACIERFLFERENFVTQSNCQDHSYCAMCWDFCVILIVEEKKIFHSMCTNYTCVSFHSFKPKNSLNFLDKNDHIFSQKFRALKQFN